MQAMVSFHTEMLEDAYDDFGSRWLLLWSLKSAFVSFDESLVRLSLDR